MSPAPDEREHIRAAMDRILSGKPEHSNGALTIVALPASAQAQAPGTQRPRVREHRRRRTGRYSGTVTRFRVA